jgi:SAM-dependent methyltransferase
MTRKGSEVRILYGPPGIPWSVGFPVGRRSGRWRERLGTVVAVTGNRWLQMIEENAGHSDWYIERFRAMASAGEDLDGEARFVDAMAPRGAAILDAGCGTGRVGGRLAALGHHVVGVDLDPVLIAAADQDHPGPTWVVADLAELDLAAMSLPHQFDIAVCAGNVMTFLDPSTRRTVLARVGAHLVPGGRLAVGFGAGRGYDFEEFFDDVATVGMRDELRLSTWDLRPFALSSEFLVAVVAR